MALAIEIAPQTFGPAHGADSLFNAVVGEPVSAPSFIRDSGSLQLNTPDPDELFEILAKWDGPYAGGNGLRQQAAAWRLAGAEGAAWLIARSSEETEIELLDRVALTLSEIGQPAIEPILRWIDCSAGSEHLCALLQALAWMDRTQSARSIDAIAAAGALPYQNAATLLGEHVKSERDPTLKELTSETFRSLDAER